MLGKARGGLVAITTRDFNRMVRYYTETLGLKERFRFKDLWAELAGNGLAVGIANAPPQARLGAPMDRIAIHFEVDDIEGTVAGLRDRGVVFVGEVMQFFHGREAYFKDPDGNPLVLHQSAADFGPAPRGKPTKPSRPMTRAPAKPKPAAKPAKKKAAKKKVAKKVAKKKAAKKVAKKKATKKPAAKKTAKKKPAAKKAKAKGKAKKRR